MTKSVLLSLGIVTLIVTGCSPQEDTTPTNSSNQHTTNPTELENSEAAPLTQAFIDQKIIAARSVVKTFGSALKTELQTAMKEAGVEHAISVCNIQAPEITHQVSASQNMKIRRVSLKNRNAANEPIGWTKRVLEQFEVDQHAGKDITQLEHHELVEINGENVFRYMKAIPTGGVCLACHGAELSPEVTEKLQQLYPNDKATGFAQGDIRGAFVITEKF